MDPATMAMLAQMFGQAKGNFGQGLGSVLGGIFNDPRRPYAEGQRAYDPWMDKASNNFNPFMQAGTGAMGNYQNWLQGMQDPSKFVNNLMGGYQESPYAKYLQDTAQRAGTNAASASGMTGSTPFANELQQNAANISSQDMQNWLSKVLGINTEYGTGNQYLMNQGYNAARDQSSLYGTRAGDEGKMAYGKEAAGQQRGGDIIGGLLKMFNF